MPLTPLQEQTSQDVAKDLDELARELEHLKGLYEQYFLGLERKEPVKLRAKVVGLIRKYAGSPIQNARIKFRYQQLVSRYNTYTLYWDRVLREIEEGRYQRDVFRARLHGIEKKPSEAAPPPQGSAPATKADPMAVLFDRYRAERTKCGEPTAGLALDAFRKQLAAQIDALKKKTGAAGVRVQVTTENGKARIKLVPK
jgi:hypothetical protein